MHIVDDWLPLVQTQVNSWVTFFEFHDILPLEWVMMMALNFASKS